MMMKKNNIDLDYFVYGIQGGKGSFSEQAINYYLKKQKIKKYKIKYLYTTSEVLKALNKSQIDFGLFAIHNSVGGLVEESIRAMANHKFKIVEEFNILIRHFLMKKREIGFEDIKRIMVHPQVLKQCPITLEEKYPDLLLTSGQGDLIDTAQASKTLSAGKLDSGIAILGPENLSRICDLEIIDQDLQDNKNNQTSFLLVKNISGKR